MRHLTLGALPLLALAGALAGCSERNTPTAPSADAVTLNPAGFIGDRPYTWTVKCSGPYGSSASWSWTAGGVTIAGTEASTYCTSTATGTGTRPAAADGFSACVNYSCDSWSFDPATAFKTHLTESHKIFDFSNPNCVFDPFGHSPGGCFTKVTATLTVDS